MMFKNKDKTNKKGFFKKVWYSIFKLEKFGEMSAEGVRRAIGYLIKLSLLASVVVGAVMVFKTHEFKNKGIKFLEEQVGEFSYKDGILSVANQETIKAPSSTFGEVIINTNIESEEEINQYLNSMEEKKGILVLKDKVILKGIASDGLVSYKYPNLLSDLEIEETNAEDFINILNSKKVFTIYAVVFAVVAVYALINISLSIIFNAFVLSIFGYLVTWVARIKMRYAAIFNLSVYSLTLSTIFNVIYILINMLTDFVITYFQLMYIAIAAIYLIASILIIKADFLRTQVEVAGIVKMSKENNDEENDDQDTKEDEKEKDKEPNKDEKKEENNKEKNDSDEPEGSQA